MNSQESDLSLVGKAFNNTIQSLKNNPYLFIPFIIFVTLESLSLIFIYLSPRAPVSLVFGPPIRTFWGEQFLHYPANFLLMPKLTSLSRMGLSLIFGSLLTGMAVAIFFDIHNKKNIKLWASLKSALKKYIYLFTAVFIYTALFYFSTKLLTIALKKYFIAGHTKLLFLNVKIWLGPILLCLNFLVAILIQSAFIYVIPILIIEEQKIVKAIIKALSLFGKLFIPTVILVGLSMFTYIPIIVLNNNAVFLITKLFPEIILFVSIISIIINSLIIDPIITLSTTFLFLKNKKKE